MKPAWPTPSPSTRPCSSPSVEVRVSDWSEMINNSPRTAPAASSDITQTHGAVHLAELHRFTDPAEAAASLTIREGDPSGLKFYLDHGRIHVGDIATTTQDAFSAWVSDRAAGLDSIMLAPTRHLVAELNRRARAHRLDHTPTSFEVRLADENLASVGDVIITRSNDRRLRLTPTDWVKNGDRWTVTRVGRRGDLTVQHNRSQLTVRLPSDYVRTSTGLGYASTIIRPKASPPTRRTASQRGRSHDSSCIRCSPAAGQPITSTSRSSATATRTASSDPTPSHRAHRPRSCNRSSPATRRPSPPASCCASSTTQRLGFSRRYSATPTASMSPPNSSSGPRPSRSSTKPTGTSPCSPTNPPGRPCGPTYSASRPKPVNTHSASC